MSMMAPNEGKILSLANLLYGAGAENLKLKLFQNNITPAEGDVAATYTVANFTGYADVTLTASQSGATWAVPTISSNLAVSQYGTNAVFTITAGAQTVYGWYIVGATSGKVYFSQAFSAGKPLDGTNSDSITIVPKISGGHL